MERTTDPDGARAGAPGAFPHLRLRASATSLVELPWDLPLADWSSGTVTFRRLDVGPSRHLVRFLESDGILFALKEEPIEIAGKEFEVLRHLEDKGLPAVAAVGLAEAPDRESAILVTEYLAHSLQYRRLLMRFPLGPGGYRDRLLDAMAWLLFDLHRGGVFWGDCSLANTLFRRDGDRIQAYLVDAETSEVHETLSDGQREYDLEILVENVAYGLADLAALQGRDEGPDDAIGAADAVVKRYRVLWDELNKTPDLQPGDRQAVRRRIRKLNDLGFSVDEIELEPTGLGQSVRLRLTVARRAFHARELRRQTGIVALENQARLLLNDLHEYGAWLQWYERRSIDPSEVAERWKTEVFEPTIERLAGVVGPDRDIIQAYCDVLEHKWLLSERAGRDVGMRAALDSYIASGAPAPEVAGSEAAAADAAEAIEAAELAEVADDPAEATG